MQLSYPNYSDIDPHQIGNAYAWMAKECRLHKLLQSIVIVNILPKNDSLETHIVWSRSKTHNEGQDGRAIQSITHLDTLILGRSSRASHSSICICCDQ